MGLHPFPWTSMVLNMSPHAPLHGDQETERPRLVKCFSKAQEKSASASRGSSISIIDVGLAFAVAAGGNTCDRSITVQSIIRKLNLCKGPYSV